MYRRMEFLLGEKSASMLVPHRGAPRVHAELEKALQQPSLYDEALRLLARRGHAIPAEVLERDLALRYEPSAGVEEVWTELYRGEQGDAGTRSARAALGRISSHEDMGAKVGTGGWGRGWLEKRASKNVFRSCTARSHV